MTFTPHPLSDPGNPYTFTWGTSGWSTSGAAWSAPGTYTASGSASAAGSTSATDQTVISTSGSATAQSSSAAESGFDIYVPAGGTGVYVSATTARLYDRLPDCYRNADAQAPGQGAGASTTSYPLLRWLSLLVDQAGAIETLINRFTSPTSSALTDPTLADDSWLPWLGQLVGVNLPSPVPDSTAARALIANAISGTPAGSRQSIIASVQAVLTGTRTVTVTDHDSGNPWQIQVATLLAESPGGAAGFEWGSSEWGAGSATWSSPTGTGSIIGQQGFEWGRSEWSTGSATWANPDPIVWWLESNGLEPAGFTFVHTTS